MIQGAIPQPSLILVLVLFASAGLAVIPAGIAESKGYSRLAWYWYGFFLFGIALIHAAILTPTPEAVDKRLADDGYLVCPDCAELSRPEATVCRYCGLQLEVEAAPVTSPLRS